MQILRRKGSLGSYQSEYQERRICHHLRPFGMWQNNTATPVGRIPNRLGRKHLYFRKGNYPDPATQTSGEHGTVFQKYALFPHLNVYDNIAFGLKLKGMDKEEIKKKVKAALKMVSMSDYEYRDVNSLSGGQQQRVAIARAIVNEPEVLLLDEPLAALDLKMRKDMQMELKEMHKRLGITFVYGSLW